MSPIFTLLRLGAQAWGVISRRGTAGRFASTYSPLELVAVLMRAIVAAGRGLPRAWQKRQHIQRSRRISVWGVLGWLTHYGMGLREIALKD